MPGGEKVAYNYARFYYTRKSSTLRDSLHALNSAQYRRLVEKYMSTGDSDREYDEKEEKLGELRDRRRAGIDQICDFVTTRALKRIK